MFHARQRFTILAIIILICASASNGQTQPSTQPTTRGARRTAVSNSPREQLPFTNGDLKAIDASRPTLFIVGDSTAARNNDADHRGWGAVLVDYFDTTRINLVNQAQGGASFPSYYATRWPAVVDALKPGDFVVIEFGHNGGHLPGTGEETRQGPARTGSAGPEVTLHTYGWYVRKFITHTRAKGATPIVSTTTVRNIWTNPNATFRDGTIVDKKDNYTPSDDRVERGMGQVLENGRRSMSVWAKQVAEEEKVPFVDHSEITADLYEKMGRESVAKFFPADHTHTSTDGGVTNAETLIAGLKTLPNMPLVDYLNEKGKAIAAYKPTGK